MNASQPRGIRNNNPGNVEYQASADPWNGLNNPPTDGRFCRFKTPEWGIRVIAKLLHAYQDRHACKTVTDIINRWAPPDENDTAEYITDVCVACKVAPAEQINVAKPQIMAALIKSIIRHENGIQPYSDEIINHGIEMAIKKQ